MGKLLDGQPVLFPFARAKDAVYTPPELARDIVQWFAPSGTCLDPCAGDGAFLRWLPPGAEWCELQRGRDFYAWTQRADWIISNPPYSDLLAWIRHSFTIATNIVYLVPLHRVMASSEFLDDLEQWGGICHIRRYGTGARWGFPFGHALAAVHWRAGHTGPATRSNFFDLAGR